MMVQGRLRGHHSVAVKILEKGSEKQQVRHAQPMLLCLTRKPPAFASHPHVPLCVHLFKVCSTPAQAAVQEYSEML